MWLKGTLYALEKIKMSGFPTKPQSFSSGQECLLSYNKRAEVFPVTNTHYYKCSNNYYAQTKMLVIKMVVVLYVSFCHKHF